MKDYLGAEVTRSVSLEELERRHIERSCGREGAGESGNLLVV